MRRFILIALASVLLSCQSSNSGIATRNVRLALHREPIAFLPFRVAQRLEYYQQEGVSVAISEAAGGSKAMEALLGGSVDVAAASVSDTIQLAAEGRNVQSFLLLYTRPALALAIAPAMSRSIRTIRDLKGRSVGVSAPGSATHQFLNFLLVSNGLSPEDVSVVSVGMAATSVAALEHAKVDAAVLIASAITTFEGRHPGRGFLADVRTPDGARRVFGSEVFPSLGLIAHRSWLQSNSDAAHRLVRAVRKGMLWMLNHTAEQARNMIPEEARSPDANADLVAIRQFQQTISPDGAVPAGAAELVEKFVAVSNPKVRAARMDVSRIYTNEFLNGN